MRKVMLIVSNQSYKCCDPWAGECLPFPPVGAIGEVVTSEDEYGELDIMFDDYPCTMTPKELFWIVHKTMIIFLDEPGSWDELEKMIGWRPSLLPFERVARKEKIYE